MITYSVFGSYFWDCGIWRKQAEQPVVLEKLDVELHS
jgi:hypothetical protein